MLIKQSYPLRQLLINLAQGRGTRHLNTYFLMTVYEVHRYVRNSSDFTRKTNFLTDTFKDI